MASGLAIAQTTGSTGTTTTTTSDIPVTGTVRLRPQVLMGGFDPILVDLTDTSFKLFAIVRPGAAPIQQVSTSANGGGFSVAMTYAGTYDNGDRRYESTFTFARGTFPEMTAGDLFGTASSQFHMTVVDTAQQTHSFPDIEFGNHVPLTAASSPATPVSSTRGTKRGRPQVLAAGFDPQLIDLDDTSFEVVAIVREGLVPIQTVSLTQNMGGFALAMNAAETHPNGDHVYRTTYTFSRGAFPAMTAGDLFGTRSGQFNFTVTDTAQQTHSFPELRWGNYPAQP